MRNSKCQFDGMICKTMHTHDIMGFMNNVSVKATQSSLIKTANSSIK